MIKMTRMDALPTADFAIRVTSALGSWKLSMPSELEPACGRVDIA